MEESNQGNEFIKENAARPNFLKVISILSFINIGFSMIGNILQMNHGPNSADEMLELKAEMMMNIDKFEKLDFEYGVILTRKLITMGEILNASMYSFVFYSILISAIGLFGVVKMWKGFKLGFHFYIVYSLLFVSANYFFVSAEYLPSLLLFLNLFISGLFIFMYSRNLKWMK